MRSRVFGVTVILLGFALFHAPPGFAELWIDTVTPNLGTIGQNLEVRVTGSGFDGNTRVSLYPDAGNQGSIIGFRDTPGFARDVDIRENLVYLADGSSGLRIMDAIDPRSPSIVGSVDTPGTANSVTVMGTVAYLADGASGLQVLDVSNPQTPLLIGSIDTPGDARDVIITDSIAYVADCGAGVQVIDVSDTGNPVIVATVDTPTCAQSLCISGTSLYVAADESGLQVIDVNDPRNPIIIGSVDTPGYAIGIAVNGNHAYIADDGNGLQIIDVNDPRNPMIKGAVETPGYAIGIAVAGTIAYVADEDYGIQIIDIRDPDRPAILGAVDTPDEARRVCVVGTTAYVADENSGLQIVDVGHPSNTTLIGAVDTQCIADAISLSGSTAYVVNLCDLQIVDIGNPEMPTIIGSIGPTKPTTDVDVVNGIAYVAAWDAGLRIIDVSNPQNPVMVGSLVTPGSASSVKVHGETAYVADWEAGLQIIDVSDPRNPTIMGSVDTPGKASGVSVSGTIACVADWDYGLQVIDIGFPQFPVLMGSIGTTGYAKDAELNGDIVYVADGTAGIQVVDITDPSNPFIRLHQDTADDAQDVLVADTTLYVADGLSGIHVHDITTPQNPILIGSVDTPRTARSLGISGGNAYVADDGVGLVVVPLPEETNSLTIGAPTSLTATLSSPAIPGHYTFRVFNNDGDYFEFPGAVTFVEPDSPRLTAKAIIVAGQGPVDTVWPETQMVAGYAYRTLKMQGYTDDRIWYLSSNTGAEGVDAYANSATLSNAINTWARDASGLFLYMVGHGEEEVFYLNPGEYVGASVVDGWLDDLQTTMTGQVFFVYDACQSGSFLPYLSPAENRVVITSGSMEKSWLFNYGYTSFSYRFWDEINENANIARAFEAASRLMAPYQSANLDANGDGRSNDPVDLSYIATELIGRGRVVDGEPSPIEAVVDPITLYGSTAATLCAQIPQASEREIDSVWAVVVAPDDGLSENPMEKALLDPDLDGIYQAAFSGLSVKGAYLAGIYARDMAGNVWHETTYITQTVGNLLCAPDAYEPDDTPEQSSVVLIEETVPHRHHFHTPTDEDWVRFYALGGEIYEIRARNPSPACDAVIQLYDTDGTTLLAEKNFRSAGGDEALYWTFDAEGIYFVRVTNADPDVFGETVRYEIQILQPYLSDAGVISGSVTNGNGIPVAGARIKTDGNGCNLSRDDGSYMIRHRPGSFQLTAEAGDSGRAVYPITVEKAGIHFLDVVLTDCAGAAPGDVNNDKTVDLIDAILSLRTVAGSPLYQVVCKEADVNDDFQIGLPEVAYVLRMMGQ